LKTKAQKKFFRLLLLHRHIGVVLVWVAIWLAITGVLLNHSDQLRLNDIKIQSPWVLKLYGLEPEPLKEGYHWRQKWWVELADAYYVDGLIFPHYQGHLVGGIALPDLLLVATRDAVIVLTAEGEPVETLRAEHGLTGQFQQLGMWKGQPVLRTSTGMFIGSADAISWQPMPASVSAVQWSEREPLPSSLIERLSVISSMTTNESEITLEKLVLDLHSGRLFGSWSWLMLDLFALLLVSGAGSGFVIWLKLRGRKSLSKS
jgi:hypothetical protein